MKMLRWLFFIVLGKGVKEMDVIYATLIVKDKKKFSDVPEKIQAQVKQILVDLGVPELAQ